MKKIFAFFSILILSGMVVTANTGDKFIESLKNCSPYSESGSLNVGGVDAQSTKQMLGWQNDKCVYKEIINYSGTNVTTICKFTQPQIREIVTTAEVYYSSLNNSGSSPDLSSIESIQNNPFARVMSKYLQDSSVCLMSGMN